MVVFGYPLHDYERDARGDNSFVHDGTGWTVRLAQRLAKPIYLCDIHDQLWLVYDYESQKFVSAPSKPKLLGKRAIEGDRHTKPTDPTFDEIQDLFYQNHLGQCSE